MGVPKATTVSNLSHHGSLSLLSNHPHPNVHALHTQMATSLNTTTGHDVESKKKYKLKNEDSAEFAEVVSSQASENGNNDSKNPSSWDPKDDILLRHLKEVKKMGWKDISQYFQNRTPNACQFRWRRLKSGNLKSNKTATLNINEYNIDLSNIPFVPNEKKQKEYKPKGKTSVPSVNISTSLDTNAEPKPASSLGPAPVQIATQNLPQNNLPLNQNPTIESQRFPTASQINPTSTQPEINSQNQFTTATSNFGNIDGATKFAKPRSMSHTVARPSNFTNQHIHPNPTSYANTFNSHSNYYSTVGASNTPAIIQPDEEKVGFVPKVFVRSRRSSFATPTTALGAQNLLSPTNNTLGVPSFALSSVKNMALGGSKSRKNSFSTRSRRSSFNVSTTTSRRPSLVVAPNSLGDVIGSSTVVSPSNSNTILSTPTSRRTSIGVPHHRQSTNLSINPTSGTFMDLPQYLKRSHNSQQSGPPTLSVRSSISSSSSDWKFEEDKILMDSVSKHLPLIDIAKMLPNRKEQEIKWRMNVLLKESAVQNNSTSPSTPLDSPKKPVDPKSNSNDTAVDEDTFEEDDEESAINDSDSPDFHLLHRETSATSSKEISPNSVYSNSSVNSNKNSPTLNTIRSVSIATSTGSSSQPSVVNPHSKENIKHLPSINNILQDMV